MASTVTQSDLDSPLGREPRRGVLAQIGEELLWPRLLRSVGLAIRPERLFVAGLTLVLIKLVLKIPALWLGQPWTDRVDNLLVVQEGAGVGWGLLDPMLLVSPIAGLAYNCAGLWEISWWTTLIMAPIVLVIFGIGWCMVSRIAACDVAQGISVGWPEAARFALDRAGSILFALIAPLILVAVIWLGLAAAGWVLFSVSWVNVIGGVLFGFFILAAAVAVVVMVAYALGFPLIVPPIACDGTDGIDALARAYPYVFGRPLRYLLYLLIVLMLGHFAVGIAAMLGEWTQDFAREAAMRWTGEGGDRVIAGVATGEGATTSERVASNLVNFWSDLVVLAVVAFAFSYFFCASTVLYLLMRRVNDGQDVGEIWMPGMIEGTMSMTMEARAKAAGGA